MAALQLELPPELLMEIFIQAKSGRMPVSPLTLGKICRGWRTISFSLANLWTSVDLTINGRFHNQVTLLEHWIDRAQSLPLALSIQSARNLRLTVKEWDRLFAVIASKAEQISSISFALPGPAYGQLAAIGRKDWPALVQISLSTSHQDDHIFFRPSPLCTFERSPQLTTAVIKQFFFKSFALPWDNLVCLELYRAAAYEVLDAIETCSNLQDFRVTLALELQQWEGPQLPLYFNSSINHFTFAVQQVFANRHAENAFMGLHLPKLKSLFFRLPSRPPGENHELYLPTAFPLDVFTPRASVHLESLTIHSGYLRVGDFLRVASGNSAMRLLALDLRRVAWDDSYEFGRRFFRPAEVGWTRPLYLPNLRTLTCEGEIDFAPEVVIRWLESRWDEAGIETLESITFIGSGKEWVMTEDQKQKCEEWNKRGFSATIR
ncbi:hypothetical protein MD484_g8810, partial [Candolleomyces efflorescens]